MIKTIL